MAPILDLFKATIGTRTYFFYQHPTAYQGSLDTITGIEEAAQTELDEPATSVSNLISKGRLFRVTITTTDGTKKRTAKILVTRDKLITALDSLIGETFKGNQTIQAARIPQKAQFF